MSGSEHLGFNSLKLPNLVFQIYLECISGATDKSSAGEYSVKEPTSSDEETSRKGVVVADRPQDSGNRPSSARQETSRHVVWKEMDEIVKDGRVDGVPTYTRELNVSYENILEKGVKGLISCVM